MRRKIISLAILVFLLTLGGVFFDRSAPVTALTGSEFQAGRIIDDGVFFNSYSLSVTQIQTFLNSKVPSCDTNGTKPYGGTTRAEYGTSRGYPPPYTCLRDYKQSIPSRSAEDSLCNGITAASNRTAAQIIDTVARSCGVSQKVLIVLLEKEQSLVTDDWPWSIQYRSATGYGCPDTAPCDSEYYGFFNQVYNAARIYKYYAKYPDSFNHLTNETNYVRYHPNSSCGGSNVFITNQATAGLYNYTPYQPNSAALNNLYGTGNSCSAYGNRNFWRIYNDWFGPTLSNAWDYSFVTSSGADLLLQPGWKRIGHYITLKNTGTETWYADGATPVGKQATRLAMRHYDNSPFADPNDPNWLGTRNQIKMHPDVVAPGENATFIFNLVGPYKIYKTPVPHNFVPIVNGITSMRDIDLQKRISNMPPTYSYASSSGLPSTLYPNQVKQLSIVLKNTGYVNWYADGSNPSGVSVVRLATKSYDTSPFADPNDPNWLGTRNQIKMTPSSVAPGENATFSFSVKGPLAKTHMRLHLIPVLDGVTFMPDISLFTTIQTPNPIASYELVSATNPPPTMSAGSSANVSITLKNKGTIVWKNESSTDLRIRLMMARPSYRNSPFYDSSANSGWVTPNQIIYSGGEAGLNGQVTFNFKWKAPSTPGTYTEYFVPVLDGYEIMQDRGMAFTVTVLP